MMVWATWPRHQVGEELLRRSGVLARRQHRGAGDVDQAARVAWAEVVQRRGRLGGAELTLQPVPK